tara:strand:- start:2090 stop:2257 length:168 start_codon:yes stop_codon:yes gene_type:complete
MDDSKISYKSNFLLENEFSSLKVICSKCCGSGNFKTSENLRRTCLECFGKGFIIV